MRFLSIFLFTFIGTSTLIMASVPASRTAHQLQFSLDREFGFGEAVEYSCFDVEWETRRFMQYLGATNVRVHCFGGYPGYFTTLRLSYETLRIAKPDEPSPIAADWKKVHVNFFDNCFLHEQVFRQVRRTFEIKDLWEPNFCFKPDHNFNMSMTTLLAL